MYSIELMPRVMRDLKKLPKSEIKKIVKKVQNLTHGLNDRNIKKLTNFVPEYRLRVGDYRILFEVEGEKIIIYRVRHRKEAYK